MAITLKGDDNSSFSSNVGIGTTSPDEALHVHATGTTQIAAEFEADNAETYIQFTGTDATQVLYGRDSADACIQVNSSDVFKAKSGGNCEIVDGNLVLAENHGIHFHNYDEGATIDSNLLDDYEEGSFTPTWSNGFAPGSYSAQHGRYTKIGNVVYFQLSITADSGSVAASHLRIGGLPFNAESASPPYGGAYIAYTTIVDDVNSSDGVPPYCLIVNGTDDIYLYKRDGNFWNANDGVGTVVNKEIRVNGFYTV